MKISIFLGAGASAADNLPIQNQLFSEYFKSLKEKDFNTDMNKELYKFFKQMFNIDIRNDDMGKVTFPTFEEVLGLLDLAEQRREGFRNFGLENLSNRSDSIRFLRQYIILLMAKAIHNCEGNNKYHKLLVKNLMKENLLVDTTFISANYDINIDNALSSLYEDYPIMLDYGIKFANFNTEETWKVPKGQIAKLYKIHGSLNWLYCPVCSSITLTPYNEGIIKLLDNEEDAKCLECGCLTVPIIIPPTYFKNMSNIFLSTVWNDVEKALRRSDVLIFCGYSFPDADIHIKYMIKKVQTNRDKGPLKIIVFNYHEGKTDLYMKREEARYKRFLGSDIIFTRNSFQDFVSNPMKYINMLKY